MKTTLKIEEFRAEVRNEVLKITTPIVNELRETKTELLEMAEQNRKLRDALSTGKHLQRNDNEIKGDEYKQYRDARLEAASLEEVVAFQAASKGVDIKNKNEFEAWLGLDKNTRSKTNYA